MQEELTMRKANRLKEYDYSQAGYYFVTICVKDKRALLGEVVGANCVRLILSETGKIIEKEISVLSGTYEHIRIDKYVIMPNHVHMIIVITPGEGRTEFAPTISRIIKQFKGSVTKQIGFSIWQKGFHDHIIRNEADYQRVWQYIDENPIKWTEDCYYTKQKEPAHVRR